MIRKRILSLTLASILFLGGAGPLFSQNAPVTTCSTISGAIAGTVISVPVTVTGFINVGAISLTIDYNYTVMQFVESIPHASLGGFISGDSDQGDGIHRITMGWFGSGTTLSDGSAIITLNFNYSGGNSLVSWFENGSSCEYANANGTVLNDSPVADYYINGYVCGYIDNPGEISGNDSVCENQEGVIYSVISLANVTGYTWSVPEGALIVSGENTNVITVNFTQESVSGIITVYGYNQCGIGPGSELAVTVNTLPLADAGDDQVINYGTSTLLQAASGGPGIYTYHWSPEDLLVDPDEQNPETVIMNATTVFTLVVTNQSGQCQSSDEMVVTIVGGPLGVYPIAIPNQICVGESSQLYANAGGGSGSYTYQWTCIPADDPPWSSSIPNPVVTPDSSKIYILNVFDGFTETNGTVTLTVNPLPTSYLSGDTTLCGPGNIATLNIDLTGVPPWSFNVTNGITTVIFENINSTPFPFLTNEAGTYSVVDLEDNHCDGNSSGTATVDIYPIPDKPEISILDYHLISSSCCGNQWYLNYGPIPGATGQVYTASESGEYFVVVTLNGCSSDTSEIVDLIVGIREPISERLLMFPNPALDFTRINTTLPDNERVYLRICALDGRLIRETELLTTTNQKDILIETSHLIPGIYFITLGNGNSYKQGKLVIR